MVDAATTLLEDVVKPEKLANGHATNRVSFAQVREGVEIIDADRRINAASPMSKVPAVVLAADKCYLVDLLPHELADTTNSSASPTGWPRRSFWRPTLGAGTS